MLKKQKQPNKTKLRRENENELSRLAINRRQQEVKRLWYKESILTAAINSYTST